MKGVEVKGCLLTVLGTGLEVEMVNWVANAANLAYCCCCGGILNRRCECALREQQKWCENGEHHGVVTKNFNCEKHWFVGKTKGS